MVHQGNVMGLPYAPNSVPPGMNPSGKRLTTRIHRFLQITEQCMVLGPNPNRLVAIPTVDAVDDASVQLSLSPDNEASWCYPYGMYYGTIAIYGGLPIYARLSPGAVTIHNGLIIIEHVYE